MVLIMVQLGVIMGASASSFWYNLRVQHPCREGLLQGLSLGALKCGRKNRY
ncbi:hypothetical protein Hanom_Chr08g00749681 [Helianthus anomalus]